jgi:hypothetical protein
MPSRFFRKGNQVLWRGKKARIINEVISNIDLVIKFEDGEMLAVSQSDLLTYQNSNGEDEAPRYPASQYPREPNWLRKKELRAWRHFREDADAIKQSAFGQQDGKQADEHTHAERLLLNRLCSGECAELMSGAWSAVVTHRKKSYDGQRVIRCMLDAFTLSKHVSLIAGDYQRSMNRLKQLADFADQLRQYFLSDAEQAKKGDTIARDPTWKMLAGSHVSEPHDATNAIIALTRIGNFLSRRIDNFSAAFSQLNLTHKDQAATAQRITFIAAMSDAMRDIFGRPLDGVVCQLTDAVFDAQGEVTVNQVKEARKSAARRQSKQVSEKDGDKLIELMRHCGVPITRDNYLDLAYLGKQPEQLTAEEEASLPPEVRSKDLHS